MPDWTQLGWCLPEKYPELRYLLKHLGACCVWGLCTLAARRSNRMEWSISSLVLNLVMWPCQELKILWDEKTNSETLRRISRIAKLRDLEPSFCTHWEVRAKAGLRLSSTVKAPKRYIEVFQHAASSGSLFVSFLALRHIRNASLTILHFELGLMSVS